MDVSIIIINYNTFDLTSDCIRSIYRFTKEVSYEIILVDNASTETDPEKFLIEFQNITLIRSPINGGFAYGNNLGIIKASGEYILLLNSDTLLQEDSISKAVSFMEQHRDVGVLGCRLVFPGGRIQHTVRKFKSIRWELLNLFRFILLLMPYKKRASLMLGKYFRYDVDIECDWIGGAFFMVPKRIIDLLPDKKLDERFFMYGEDQIWCDQIRKLGYKIFFFSGTTVIHIYSGSTKLSKQIAMRKLHMKHELKIMELRKGRGLYYYIFKAIFVTKETARNLIKSIVLRLTGRLVYR
jgi:GT2 family glycosyltransferase